VELRFAAQAPILIHFSIAWSVSLPSVTFVYPA